MRETDYLRVIIEHDDEGFVAQCVDYNIFGIGPTEDEAINEFCRAFIRHVLVARQMGDEPLASVEKPTQDYEVRWAQAEATSDSPREFDIPEFTIQNINARGVTRHCRALVA